MSQPDALYVSKQIAVTMRHMLKEMEKMNQTLEKIRIAASKSPGYP